MEQRIGYVGIFPIRYFGRWRVIVCKLARTSGDLENTLSAIKADNWQDLEARASAYLLAKYGTVAIGGTHCPPTLARSARWQHWAERNITRKARRNVSAH